MNCRGGGSRRGRGPLKSLKSHCPRARGPAAWFACSPARDLRRGRTRGSPSHREEEVCGPASARRVTAFAFAKDEQSARGAGRIEVSMATT